MDDLDASGDSVIISATGAIEESTSTDTTTDILAATIDLAATTGIGGTRVIQLAGANISADTTNGDIDLDNTTAVATTVSSLTTGAGAIQFDQDGSGSVSFTTVTTGNGAISLTSDDSNLHAGAVSSGGVNNISLITTNAGSVTVDDVNAGTNSVFVSAAGGIDESTSTDTASDIIATNIDLDAATGIGASRVFQLAGSNISADTTDGDIDLDNKTTAATTVSSLTSATGDIRFDQSDTGAVTFASVTTGGAISLSSDNADLTASVVTASGTGNISITTAAAGDINVGSVNAGSNTATVNAAGSIEESGADATADIVAAALDLDAGTGIGTAATLEVTGASIAADSTAGNIDIDSLATVAVTVTSLTTGGTGTLQFDQTGNQALQITSAGTADGAISITNTGANLTAVGVSTGNNNQIDLQTLVSGSILVDNVNAGTGNLNVISAGAIDETVDEPAVDLAGGVVTLTAVSGIGETNDPEISASTSLNVDNTSTGNIDIRVIGDVTLTGNVRNQAVGGGLAIEAVNGSLNTSVSTLSTSNGQIDLSATDTYGTPVTVTNGSGRILRGGG
ncbi:MAG: hypothetical protein HUJ31_03645, partial [Pseudomonadales bacterium]|nr:hypothetical protein [Pseudomonadales bacterium]